MSKARDSILAFITIGVMFYLGYILGQVTPKVKQVPKSIECHDYIPPCSEEITFNTDVPNKCWIEED